MGRPRGWLNAMFPEPIRLRLRLAAAMQDRDISNVNEDALGQYLHRWEAEQTARGLPPLLSLPGVR